MLLLTEETSKASACSARYFSPPLCSPSSECRSRLAACMSDYLLMPPFPGEKAAVVVDPVECTVKVRSDRLERTQAWSFPVVFPVDVTQADVFEEVRKSALASDDGQMQESGIKVKVF